MASIVSKLTRAASATRAFPLADRRIAVGGRPAAAIRVSPAGGPSSEDESARSKSEVTPHASIVHRNPQVDENVLKSKETMWAFYEHWCKWHGISRDRREMERRFKIFSDTERHVYTINSSSSGCRLGMTKFADMTKEEWKAMLGYRRPKK